jgi:hypothetical protein
MAWEFLGLPVPLMLAESDRITDSVNRRRGAFTLPRQMRSDPQKTICQRLAHAVGATGRAPYLRMKKSRQ